MGYRKPRMPISCECEEVTQMKNENCEILFEYLRSILYDKEIQAPDIEQLDQEYQRLGKGLQVLQRQVEEMLEYSEDLANGNLSGNYPPRDNFLCRNLKGLHANMNHLTWQAKQVAEGDYSQHVSYLGDFSASFNTMIRQLRDRELELREDVEIEKNRALAMEGYNKLLVQLTSQHQEWIVVVEQETKEVLYCNQEQFLGEKGCENCKRRLDFQREVLAWNDGDSERVREKKDGTGCYYRITTIDVEWRGHWAYAHIIEDITREKLEVQNMTSKAYTDTLTGISNRHFFDEFMGKLLADKKFFTLAYLDLDNLKYVNDHFGHQAGNRYILNFVSAVKKEIREDDLFARIGGDEFCLVFRGCHKEVAEQKLKEILNRFRADGNENYRPSFSFGLVEADLEREPLSLEEILERADARMYEFKRAYKKQLEKTGGRKQSEQ